MTSKIQIVVQGTKLISDYLKKNLRIPSSIFYFSVQNDKYYTKVKNTNVAIIMVEQNAKQALSISDRGYVLVTGENKFEGSGNELLQDSEVRRSFLGA